MYSNNLPVMIFFKYRKYSYRKITSIFKTINKIYIFLMCRLRTSHILQTKGKTDRKSNTGQEMEVSKVHSTQKKCIAIAANTNTLNNPTGLDKLWNIVCVAFVSVRAHGLNPDTLVQYSLFFKWLQNTKSVHTVPKCSIFNLAYSCMPVN